MVFLLKNPSLGLHCFIMSHHFPSSQTACKVIERLEIILGLGEKISFYVFHRQLLICLSVATARGNPYYRDFFIRNCRMTNAFCLLNYVLSTTSCWIKCVITIKQKSGFANGEVIFKQKSGNGRKWCWLLFSFLVTRYHSTFILGLLNIIHPLATLLPIIG